MSLEILAEAALGFPNDQPVAVTQKVPCHVRASVFSPCEGGGGVCVIIFTPILSPRSQGSKSLSTFSTITQAAGHKAKGNPSFLPQTEFPVLCATAEVS